MHDLLLWNLLHNQLLLIMNITLNVTRDQYEMIIKALDYFNEGLKQRLAHRRLACAGRHLQRVTVSVRQ